MMNSKNNIAIPPGATIKEQLEYRGMAQKEFAVRMDMSEKHISRLINGKVELTSDVALRLESVLGVPAKFWINLEAKYREQITRVAADLEAEQEIETAAKFPYSKLASLGWVPKTRSQQEKVLNLRAFFEVAKLTAIDKLCIPGIAYRKTGENSVSNYSLAAWGQKARLEGRKVETAPINIAKLEASIPQIRSFTVLDPTLFYDELVRILANCGISLVVLPHIDGSFLHGASFVDGKKIILGLTVRGKDADKFWFSLFHELFHIIDGHINLPGDCTQEEEAAADLYATNVLIDPNEFEKFIGESDFSKTSIVHFSEKIEILPGIVLGRLQKENYLKYNQYHELKVKYEIA